MDNPRIQNKQEAEVWAQVYVTALRAKMEIWAKRGDGAATSWDAPDPLVEADQAVAWLRFRVDNGADGETET